MLFWLVQALKRYEQSKVSHQPPETLYLNFPFFSHEPVCREHGVEHNISFEHKRGFEHNFVFAANKGHEIVRAIAHLFDLKLLTDNQ